MFEGYVKRRLEPALKQIHDLIAPLCQADTITALGFLTGIFAGVAIAFGQNIVALSLLAFSGFCDVLDGAIARGTSQEATLTAFKDLVSDRMVESALMLGIVAAEPEYGFVCLLFMASLLLHFSTFGIATSLFANKDTESIYYHKSYVERLDAFLVFAFVFLFPAYTEPVLLLLSLAIFIDGGVRFKKIITFAQIKAAQEANAPVIEKEEIKEVVQIKDKAASRKKKSAK